METILLLLTIALAVVDWIAADRKITRLHFVTKPAVILALLAWFSVSVGWQAEYLWFGLALVFSLAGDIFLLLPGNFFLPGLVSFLLAHVCYIVGFNQKPMILQPVVLVFLVLLAGLGFTLFSRLTRSPEGRKMGLPVAVYSFIICLMVFSALTCLLRPLWSVTAAVLVSLGSLFFVTSDSVLAYNRFVRATPHNDLFVMVTYHLAQMLIISGVII